MAKASKKPVVRQVAALPYRLAEDGSPRVALVTSRGTGRWILPKGWPIKGMKNADAARTEALEEAGLKGSVSRRPIGQFLYEKVFPKKSVEVLVDVFSLEVEAELDDYPEKGQRRVEWLPIEDAAERASIPEVAAVIRAFAERLAEAETDTAPEEAPLVTRKKQPAA